jgi:hypothetical protein
LPAKPAYRDMKPVFKAKIMGPATTAVLRRVLKVGVRSLSGVRISGVGPGAHLACEPWSTGRKNAASIRLSSTPRRSGLL